MMNELAKRAVACKHWRWMPGMLGRTKHSFALGVRYVGKCGHSGLDEWWNTGSGELEIERDGFALPNLTDPATLGCLLALVREAWDDPTLCCRITDGRIGGPDGPFAWEFNGRIKHGWGWRTEAETLIAALEAAP